MTENARQKLRFIFRIVLDILSIALFIFLLFYVFLNLMVLVAQILMLT